MNKDKTRPTQLIPCIDVFEKVVVHLPTKAGKSPEQQAEMTGEEIIEAMGGLSVFAEAAEPRAATVTLPVSANAVDAAVSLSTWFSNSYQLTMGARREVLKFKETDSHGRVA